MPLNNQTNLSYSIVFFVFFQDLIANLSFRFLLILTFGLPEEQTSLLDRFSSFLLTITRSCHQIRLYLKIKEDLVYLILPRTDSTLRIYHLFVWSNLDFLYNSYGIPFTSTSCIVLYSFIPLVRMVKFRFLCPIPMESLSPPHHV